MLLYHSQSKTHAQTNSQESGSAFQGDGERKNIIRFLPHPCQIYNTYLTPSWLPPSRP